MTIRVPVKRASNSHRNRSSRVASPLPRVLPFGLSQRKERMQTDNTSEFPKTVEALAALDATRDIPFLAFQCALHGIQLQNPNPTPMEALRAAENHLHNHRCRRLCDFPGGQQAWASVCNDLGQFIKQLRPLATASDTKVDSQADMQSGTRNGTPPGTTSGPRNSTPETSTSFFIDQIQQFLTDFDPK